MKIATILLLCGLLSCKQSSWKQTENTDYNKDSLLYDCENFYLFKRGSQVIVTFDSGCYDTSHIKRNLLGVIKVSYHKAWIDSGYFNLPVIKKYFGEFTNRRIR